MCLMGRWTPACGRVVSGLTAMWLRRVGSALREAIPRASCPSPGLEVPRCRAREQEERAEGEVIRGTTWGLLAMRVAADALPSVGHLPHRSQGTGLCWQDGCLDVLPTPPGPGTCLPHGSSLVHFHEAQGDATGSVFPLLSTGAPARLSLSWGISACGRNRGSGRQSTLTQAPPHYADHQ